MRILDLDEVNVRSDCFGVFFLQLTCIAELRDLLHVHIKCSLIQSRFNTCTGTLITQPQDAAIWAE